jgi:hypothetical protein
VTRFGRTAGVVFSLVASAAGIAGFVLTVLYPSQTLVVILAVFFLVLMIGVAVTLPSTGQVPRWAIPPNASVLRFVTSVLISALPGWLVAIYLARGEKVAWYGWATLIGAGALGATWVVKNFVRVTLFVDTVEVYKSATLTRLPALAARRDLLPMTELLTSTINIGLARIRRPYINAEALLVRTSYYEPDFERNLLILKAPRSNHPWLNELLKQADSQKQLSVPLLANADGRTGTASAAAEAFFRDEPLSSEHFRSRGEVAQRIRFERPGHPWANALSHLLSADYLSRYQPEEFVALPVVLGSVADVVHACRLGIIGASASAKLYFSEAHLRLLRNGAMILAGARLDQIGRLERVVRQRAFAVCLSALDDRIRARSYDDWKTEISALGKLLRLWREGRFQTSWLELRRITDRQVLGWTAHGRGVDLDSLVDAARGTEHIFDLDYEMWLSHIQSATANLSQFLRHRTVYLTVEKESFLDATNIARLSSRCPYLRQAREQGVDVAVTLDVSLLRQVTSPVTLRCLYALEEGAFGIAVRAETEDDVRLVMPLLSRRPRAVLKVREACWNALSRQQLDTIRHQLAGCQVIAEDVNDAAALEVVKEKGFAVAQGLCWGG